MRTIETWEKRLERHTGHAGPSHIKGHEEAEAMMKLQEIKELRSALEKAERERDAALEASRLQNEWVNTLLDERAALAAQEPFAYCVIDPDGGSLEYSAQWPEACHEHINDCINEQDVEGAGKWVVRPLFAAAGAAPDLVKLITQLHKAKGRYHTQLALCDLLDAVGLPSVRPVKDAKESS